ISMKKKKDPPWLDFKIKGRGLTALDGSILRFLWKWKLAPAYVLHAATARSVSPRSFVKRLKKLERNELICANWEVNGGFYTWELREGGFYAIRESLGGIRDLGFRSASRVHDRLLLAFHLGEWVFEETQKPHFVTEQMLLRFDRELLPRWVPNPSYHRP